MIKIEDNPPIIWPEHKTVPQLEGCWWVAHTKARNEKALAQQMMRQEVQYFLPLVEKVYKRSRRVHRSLLPLFGGYVFLCGTEDDRLAALKTNRIANIINVKEQQKLIDELAPIEIALRNGLELKHENTIEEGTYCRVIAGPLMGTEGYVVKRHNEMRLLLQVDMLGQASSLEISSDLLEPVE